MNDPLTACHQYDNKTKKRCHDHFFPICDIVASRFLTKQNTLPHSIEIFPLGQILAGIPWHRCWGYCFNHPGVRNLRHITLETQGRSAYPRSIKERGMNSMKLHLHRIRRFGRAFWLLPTAFSLLIVLHLTSCKAPVVPPDDWPPEGPDTTSHNFTWQIDTIGVSGILYDVAIINDTLAYAVGEIYLNDSTGQIDPQLYNVAVWNGRDWTLSRATNVPLRAVFAFAENDIWAGSSAPYHWNGTNWTGHNVTGIFGGNINKIWGNSSSDVYIVGTNGSLARFDGDSWQKIESGTSLDIIDIYGVSSGSEATIISVASRLLSTLDREILSIQGSQVVILSDSGITEPLSGVWFVPGKKYMVAGSGYYRKGLLSDPVWEGYPTELTQYYTHAVRGTDTSDVFLAGAFGSALHYNGVSWHTYSELSMTQGGFYSLSFQGNTVSLVGRIDNKAIAVIGKRFTN